MLFTLYSSLLLTYSEFLLKFFIQTSYASLLLMQLCMKKQSLFLFAPYAALHEKQILMLLKQTLRLCEQQFPLRAPYAALHEIIFSGIEVMYS
jgi:hypothetical protein